VVNIMTMTAMATTARKISFCIDMGISVLPEDAQWSRTVAVPEQLDGQICTSRV